MRKYANRTQEEKAILLFKAIQMADQGASLKDIEEAVGVGKRQLYLWSKEANVIFSTMKTKTKRPFVHYGTE